MGLNGQINEIGHNLSRREIMNQLINEKQKLKEFRASGRKGSILSYGWAISAMTFKIARFREYLKIKKRIGSKEE